MKCIEFYNKTFISVFARNTDTMPYLNLSLAKYRDLHVNDNGTRLQYVRDMIAKYPDKKQSIKGWCLTAYLMSSVLNMSDVPLAEVERRNMQTCAKHFNGVMCVDFDNVAQNDVQSLAEYLYKLPSVFMVSLSVSGKGLYCLVAINYHVDNYKYAYLNFISELPKVYQKYVDQQVTDISRLRYDSDYKKWWKPDNYTLEPYSRPLQQWMLDEIDRRAKAKMRAVEYKNNATSDQLAKDLKNVECIIKKMLACPKLCVQDYTAWYGLLKQIYGAFGEKGEDYARQLSMSAPNYNEKAFISKWKRVCSEPSNGLNIGYWVNINKQLKNLK